MNHPTQTEPSIWDSVTSNGLSKFFSSIQDEGAQEALESLDTSDFFEFLLDTPLLNCLSDHTVRSQYLLELSQSTTVPTTISECLSTPGPRCEYLDQVRHRISSLMKVKEGMNSVKEAAAVLYYLTMACEIQSPQFKRSMKNQDDLKLGLQWGAKQLWLNEDYRSILSIAILEITSHSNH